MRRRGEKHLRVRQGRVGVLQEVVDLLFLLGKSLPQLRVFKEFEGELLLCCLSFLVEATQGPCKANQDYLGNARKPVDVCKNIFCTEFTKLKDKPELSMSIFSKAMQLIAALLESRGSDETIHIILRDQIPSKMLNTRLKHCRKKDLELAKAMANSHGQTKQGWKDLQAINTAEVISIHNSVGELKEYSTAENDFTFLDRDAVEEGGKTEGLLDNVELLGLDGDVLEIAGGGDDDDFESGGEGGSGSKDDAEEEDEEEIEGREFNFIQVVDAIELVWHGECVKVHFTLPSEWHSFSERKK